MMNVQSGDLFFFYGLLKQGAAGSPDHIDLAGGGEFLGPASIRGVLYHLGDYPGVIEGEGVVQGMLYRLNDLNLMPLLDEFEDFDPDDAARSMYLRRCTPLLDRNCLSTNQQAWVYWYNFDIHDQQQIKSGNWPE
ncbi:MAG: hypothetical protein CMK07_14600 [Ponticaulis sp.]|nr:hypothetical protein [Ponticaulis sp.]